MTPDRLASPLAAARCFLGARLDDAQRCGKVLPKMNPLLAALVAMIGLLLAVSGSAFASQSEEPTPFERLALVGKVLRIQFRSQHMQDVGFGDSEVDRWKPDLNIRTRFALGDRAVGQIRARFRAGIYDVRGDPFPDQGVPELQDFYDASINLQGAQTVEFMPRMLDDDEVWSILADVFWRARWEPGAFSEGTSGGAALGLGYALSDRLRLGLGIAVKNRFGSSGAVVRPVAYLRWRINQRLLLRNRGLGAQLEVRVREPLWVYASGYRETLKFIRDRAAPDDDILVFRDRPSVLLGAGFRWQITPHLRLVAEGGAVLSRKLRILSDGDPVAGSETADTHSFFELRFVAGR